MAKTQHKNAFFVHFSFVVKKVKQIWFGKYYMMNKLECFISDL